MTIRLKPELEALVQRDVQRGPYQSADEFLEQAIQMLHEHEEWLSANRADISQKIEDGYMSAQRGDLIDADQVRTLMDEKKRAWRAKPREG